MTPSLILDPRTERAANSPLEILTEPGKGAGVYVTDHKYPDPEQEVLSAGGREGKRRTGPPIMGNRQIPLELFVMGRREDFATAPVNLATNPKGEVSKKFTGVGVDYAVTRELATGPVPAYLGEFRDKHAYDGVGGDTNAGFVAIVFPAAGIYTVSNWVWLPSNWTGGGPTPALEGYVGATVKSTVIADLARRNEWQRVYQVIEVVAGDLAGNYVLRQTVAPASAGTGIFYSDCLMVNAGAAPLEYFDGDSPGSSWTAAVHASTSTQPAEGQRHFEAMVGDLEGKLTKIRDEGGTYSRPYQSGRLVFDVEGLAGGDNGGYEGKRWIQRGQKFATSLECLPHGRGETQTRSLQSQTTDPVLVFNELVIPGSVRALGELEISDAAAIARRGTVAAIEVPDYDYTQPTAGLYYQAETLTPLGSSTLAAAAGATGAGNNTIQTVLSEAWRPLASTKIAASGKHLTHVGLFRIFARVKVTAGATPPTGSELQYRLEWGQGDLVERVTNDPAKIVARSTADYYIIDLGLVRIRPAKVGVQRWEGQIIARAYDPAGAGTFKPTSNIDDIRVAPASFAYLQVKAPRTKLAAPTSITNYDTFAQAAGALNGKTAESGGVWATVNGDGAGVGDFQVGFGGFQRARRETVGLRIATLPGVIAGSVLHRAWLIQILWQGAFRTGLVLRYVDANNFLAAIMEGTKASGVGAVNVSLAKWVAGVRTTIASAPVPANAGFPFMSVFVGASGYCELYLDPFLGNVNPSLGDPLIYGYDSALATGGVLASGKCGLYNYWETAGQNMAEWEWMETWPPVESTLIAPGRRLRWRHDGVQREDVAGGEQWSEIGYQGDPLYVPPSTKEIRPMRAIVFPTRGDFDAIPDAGNSDDFTARLALTSRHLSVR